MTGLTVRDVLSPRELTTIKGESVSVPDPDRLVHLQFRRYAGCPVCNLHLRSFAARHGELLAAAIREGAVFHSRRETMLDFQGQLPFGAVADPRRTLYADFGADRQISPLAALDPRSWRGRGPGPSPAAGGGGGAR